MRCIIADQCYANYSNQCTNNSCFILIQLEINNQSLLLNYCNYLITLCIQLLLRMELSYKKKKKTISGQSHC